MWNWMSRTRGGGSLRAMSRLRAVRCYFVPALLVGSALVGCGGDDSGEPKEAVTAPTVAYTKPSYDEPAPLSESSQRALRGQCRALRETAQASSGGSGTEGIIKSATALMTARSKFADYLDMVGPSTSDEKEIASYATIIRANNNLLVRMIDKAKLGDFLATAQPVADYNKQVQAEAGFAAKLDLPNCTT